MGSVDISGGLMMCGLCRYMKGDNERQAVREYLGMIYSGGWLTKKEVLF